MPSRPLQALRPFPLMLRPKPPLTAHPRLPVTPNSSPTTNSGRTGLICLSCQSDDPSSSAQQRLDHEAAMDRAFGSRARYYDNDFHREVAADYLKWIDLKPGQNIADMACGTGLISIPAKSIVGPSGRVAGIDISSGMLYEARRKAQDAEADILFLQDDVTDLKADSIPFKVDVITCASAFILLNKQISTLRQWSSYLKPGGRIILDIPTESSRLTGQVMALVAQKVGLDIFFGSTRAELALSLRDLFQSAGLRPTQVFPTQVYRTVEYDLYQGLGKLQSALVRPSSPWRTDFALHDLAVEIYVDEFSKRMGRSGMVREDIWFYVGVGTPVE
ncbi:hypothetical protein MMC19_001487 [Ptychographa xylographoides]|nr:hypothetical protein [Ptychographa xylographoides]